MAFKHTCLRCGSVLDGHTAADLSDGAPRVGDVCVCLYCGNIAIVAVGRLREPTPDEWAVLEKDEGLRRAVIAATLTRMQRAAEGRTN